MDRQLRCVLLAGVCLSGLLALADTAAVVSKVRYTLRNERANIFHHGEFLWSAIERARHVQRDPPHIRARTGSCFNVLGWLHGLRRYSRSRLDCP
uniref:Uncharacterized protein n=1 Tax=Timema cristinae TaxID=61476 RepID=A0A7R9DBJ8_TIMCR|nr:unnamed protein product [Timema cristinae]